MAVKKTDSDDTATAQIPNARGPEAETATIAVTTKFSDEALSGISDFNEALALLNETLGEGAVALASEVLGNGFALLDTKLKHTLVGVTFVIIDWSFHMGDNSEYVFARLVTMDNKKLCITDGSQGIFKQLALYTANTGKSAGLVVKKGLRRSDYTIAGADGKDTGATTYYLDTSA